jgi:hypothetical protein
MISHLVFYISLLGSGCSSSPKKNYKPFYLRNQICFQSGFCWRLRRHVGRCWNANSGYLQAPPSGQIMEKGVSCLWSDLGGSEGYTKGEAYSQMIFRPSHRTRVRCPLPHDSTPLWSSWIVLVPPYPTINYCFQAFFPSQFLIWTYWTEQWSGTTAWVERETKLNDLELYPLAIQFDRPYLEI